MMDAFGGREYVLIYISHRASTSIPDASRWKQERYRWLYESSFILPLLLVTGRRSTTVSSVFN